MAVLRRCFSWNPDATATDNPLSVNCFTDPEARRMASRSQFVMSLIRLIVEVRRESAPAVHLPRESAVVYSLDLGFSSSPGWSCPGIPHETASADRTGSPPRTST